MSTSGQPQSKTPSNGKGPSKFVIKVLSPRSLARPLPRPGPDLYEVLHKTMTPCGALHVSYCDCHSALCRIWGATRHMKNMPAGPCADVNSEVTKGFCYALSRGLEVPMQAVYACLDACLHFHTVFKKCEMDLRKLTVGTATVRDALPTMRIRLKLRMEEHRREVWQYECGGGGGGAGGGGGGGEEKTRARS